MNNLHRTLLACMVDGGLDGGEAGTSCARPQALRTDAQLHTGIVHIGMHNCRMARFLRARTPRRRVVLLLAERAADCRRRSTAARRITLTLPFTHRLLVILPLGSLAVLQGVSGAAANWCGVGCGDRRFPRRPGIVHDVHVGRIRLDRDRFLGFALEPLSCLLEL